ncbi:hypothetical protein TNCV_107461 [Trichonephila clavipes]|nr:hypothetical protein TNCV_107461 [Trichonephila clavipes]
MDVLPLNRSLWVQQDVMTLLDANPTILFTPSFMTQTRCLSDQCTWSWCHWLLFDLGKAPTPRMVVIMVEEELAPH